MYIIIIGGGAIGEHIAKKLIEKRQDVILIENDKERVKEIRESLDINIINGNGANVDVLEKANIRSANMVISVMRNDDANIVACMLAKTYSESITTVARVRDPESAGSIDIDTLGLAKNKIGIDVIISPEKAVAQELVKTILFPDVDQVEYFAQEKVKLLGKTIDRSSELRGLRIEEVKLPRGSKFVGVGKKNGSFNFPSNRIKIEEGDRIYLIGGVKSLRSASKLLYKKESKVRRVLILGGGLTGLALAEDLETENGVSFKTKIIEASPDRCEELNDILKKTIIIQGDETEKTYLNEEEIQEADVLISVTGDDRINLIASVMARQLGVKKVINTVSDMAYRPIYPKLGINSVIDPQLITAEKILRYVHKEEVVSLAIFEQDVEIFEVVIGKGCQVLERKIGDIDFPKEMLIGAIVRDETVVIPDRDTILKSSDHLVVIALGKISLDLDSYFTCKI